MFLLKFIPDFLIYLILFTSIVCYFLTKFFPDFSYVLLVKNCCAIIIPVFIFISGMVYANNWWLQKQELHTAQVEVANNGSKIINGIIFKKSEDQNKQVDLKVIEYTKYITRELTKYDNTCVIPQEFITIHNEAIK